MYDMENYFAFIEVGNEILPEAANVGFAYSVLKDVAASEWYFSMKSQERNGAVRHDWDCSATESERGT